MDWETSEWGRAVHCMSEVERAAACGHLNRFGRVCPDCGDEADYE